MGVGVAVGGTVAVRVAVGVGVFVGVAVLVGVGVGVVMDAGYVNRSRWHNALHFTSPPRHKRGTVCTVSRSLSS